jgi:hypothetical protein
VGSHICRNAGFADAIGRGAVKVKNERVADPRITLSVLVATTVFIDSPLEVLGPAECRFPAAKKLPAVKIKAWRVESEAPHQSLGRGIKRHARTANTSVVTSFRS